MLSVVPPFLTQKCAHLRSITEKTGLCFHKQCITGQVQRLYPQELFSLELPLLCGSDPFTDPIIFALFLTIIVNSDYLSSVAGAERTISRKCFNTLAVSPHIIRFS